MKIPRDENLGSLRGFKKIQYIWDYYKFPIIILCIFLYFAAYALYRHITQKDTVLYTGLVNVIAGEDLTERLTAGFLECQGLDPARNELTLYINLYLTDDELNAYHEYTYASRMKILASIEGRMLDVVLLNREAFEAFSQNGYLCNLAELLSQNDPALYESVRDSLVDGIVILEDNSADLIFNDSVPYQAKTEEYPMALELSRRGTIGEAGFEDAVYVGIIANSPRTDTAIEYLSYLLSDCTDHPHDTQIHTSRKH